MSFVVVIPARFESSRLPGKVLADIAGKPMIQWVVEKALASGAEQVIVATDNDDVAKVVKSFGGEVCKTRADHQSGTERLAEVMETYQFSDQQVIVNVQGDEPFIPVENIVQVAGNLSNQSQARMATTIPYDRERFLNSKHINTIGDFYLRHIGIYAYRAGFIKDYVQWPTSQLEQVESLEQLRVLWQGEKIHVAVANTALEVEGVDTPEDLEKARLYANSL